MAGCCPEKLRRSLIEQISRGCKALWMVLRTGYCATRYIRIYLYFFTLMLHDFLLPKESMLHLLGRGFNRLPLKLCDLTWNWCRSQDPTKWRSTSADWPMLMTNVVDRQSVWPNNVTPVTVLHHYKQTEDNCHHIVLLHYWQQRDTQSNSRWHNKFTL